jgi:hypothetical protein
MTYIPLPDINKQKDKIPHVKKHERLCVDSFTGAVLNSKEYCQCSECKEIRKRRDNIYSKDSIYRLMRILIR